MRIFKLTILLSLLVLIMGCSHSNIQDYKTNTPVFDMQDFFSGSLEAHGVVKNRSGKVIRHFNATIEASWDDDGIGILDERFVFDDGEKQTRVWTLTPNSDGTYTGTAGDVVGKGLAQLSGNALFMKYKLEVPYNGSTIVLDIDDRMYLTSEDVLINESIMYKWGIRVGEITLTIIKSSNNS